VTWEYDRAKDLNLPPAQRWKSEQREPGLLSWMTHHGACVAGRLYFRCWHRALIAGAEHLPRVTPFVVVANHSSHLDAVFLATCMPRAVRGRAFPLAAGDLFFENPPISAFAAAVINALPMWRKKAGRHALDDLRARLHAGGSAFILFPEGTRSRTGEPLPWKPGIGMLVTGTTIPVIPCRLWGAFEALPPHARLPRPVRLRARFGAPRTYAHLSNDRTGWQSVAADLQQAVEALPDPLHS
jgi:1-acyl-sn-glycerol-3-phosphate acyltransferase